MRRPFLRIFLVLLATAAVGGLTFVAYHNYPWLFSTQYTIRIATGPVAASGDKFIAAFHRELALEYPRVKVKFIRTESLNASAEALKKFVKITREAYESVELDAKVGVKALLPHCRPERSEEFLKKSQESINRFYSDGSQLGTMSEQRWEVWLTWLEEQNMVQPGTVKVENLYTNEFHNLR